MCEAVENFGNYRENRGKEQGEEHARIKDIQSLMKNLNITTKEAMELLNIPQREHEKFLMLVG